MLLQRGVLKLKLLKLYIFVASATLLISGCGKKSAPPPPKVRSDLVLGLYDAMDARRHEDGIRKIARLREIAPSDVFLANLEKCERNNSILMVAQKLIDIGDIKGACEAVEDGIIKYGRHPELMNAKKKLNVTNKIQTILEMFKNPYDSDSLESNAVMLKEIASSYKPAKMFLPIAAKEMKKAAKLRAWEKKLAIDGLCSQIATLLSKDENGDSNNVGILYAVLEIADKNNDVLLKYRDYIAGKGNSSLKVYKEEDIFDSLTTTSEEPKTEEKVEVESMPQEDENKQETTTKELKEKKKETGGWWKKFSF